jgi:hypothetical protein
LAAVQTAVVAEAVQVVLQEALAEREQQDKVSLVDMDTHRLTLEQLAVVVAELVAWVVTVITHPEMAERQNSLQ